MRRLIVLLCCLLTLGLGWANPSFAQSETVLAEGERMAAAGDIEVALKLYEELTRSEPRSHQAFARLGGMQLLSQRYADAVRSFQQAISLGEDGSGSFIGMGMAYLHMGQLGPARASFVEAGSRGVKNAAEVDQIIGWIDARDGALQPAQH